MENPEAPLEPVLAANSPSPSAPTAAKEQVVTGLSTPTYAAAFRCIGASCEDHCCGDWNIPLDRKTYDRYRQFPAQKLGSIVSEFVLLNAPGQPDSLFATIHLRPSGACPFFRADHLCGIQQEYGPELLSSTCSIYPRSLSRVAGNLEGSLSLSCPEAARNVLLDPNFMQTTGNLLSGDFRTDNVFHLACDRTGALHKPEALFAPIRTLLTGMVTDRSRPLWHRLLLIGSLCKRMDEVVVDHGAESLPEILTAHRRILEQGAEQKSEQDSLRAEFEAIPSQPRLKLEILFALSDQRVQNNCGKRFRDTFWTFVEGIASSDNAPPEDDIDRFLRAEKQYHRPFFDKYPFILENYLLNYMLQHLFPYGRTGSPDFAPGSMFGEFIRMTTHFAWIDLLLVGVSASHKEVFAGEHVVHTVQSFTRAVEHSPVVLKSIDDYIRIKGLDNLQGMAILLKS